MYKVPQTHSSKKRTMFYVAILRTILLLEPISGGSTTVHFYVFLRLFLKQFLSPYIVWNAANWTAGTVQHFALRSFLQWKNSHPMASHLAITRLKNGKLRWPVRVLVLQATSNGSGREASNNKWLGVKVFHAKLRVSTQFKPLIVSIWCFRKRMFVDHS